MRARASEVIVVPSGLVRLGEWLHAASPWRVLAVLAAVRAVLVGLHTTPNVDRWVLFTQDPFGSPPIPTSASYITGSPLGPIIGHLLGVTTAFGVGVLHFAVLAAGVALLVGLSRRWVGDPMATCLVVLLFASPLSNVLLTWLGQPDPFVVAAGGIAAISSAAPRPAIGVVAAGTAGVVLGLSAFEQGVVAALALVLLSEGSTADRLCLTSLGIGLVAGRAGLAGFHALSDVAFATRQEYFQSFGIDAYLRGWFANLPALIFSAFGAGWLVMGRWAKRESGAWWPAAIAAVVLCFAVSMTALDETRVLTLLLWPVVVRLARSRAAGMTGDRVILPVTMVLGALLPPIVVWEGAVYVSHWLEILGPVRG